jgi:hypothetical protein
MCSMSTKGLLQSRLSSNWKFDLSIQYQKADWKNVHKDECKVLKTSFKSGISSVMHHCVLLILLKYLKKKVRLENFIYRERTQKSTNKFPLWNLVKNLGNELNFEDWGDRSPKVQDEFLKAANEILYAVDPKLQKEEDLVSLAAKLFAQFSCNSIGIVNNLNSQTGMGLYLDACYFNHR